MAHHELQIWSEFFQPVRDGMKTAEWRRDRGFAQGDTLLLREWDNQTEMHTGEACTVAVTHLVRGPMFGIPEGYCMMSIRLITG